VANKDKVAKLEAKLKRQTIKAGNTATKLRKALGQKASADNSLSNTTPS
jgi:hypothetical protein